jgi:hypothetical protein
MYKLNVFVICPNDEQTEKLTTFIASIGQQVDSQSDPLLGLDYIVDNKPQMVLIYENNKVTTAQDFIIKASQRKVFSCTTFILVTDNKISGDDKIRMMTLGFSHFLHAEFNEVDKNLLEYIIEEEIKFQNRNAA